MTEDRSRVSRRWILGAFGAAGWASAGLPAWALGGVPAHSPRPLARPAYLAQATRAAAPTATELVEAAKLGGDVAYMVIEAATGRVLEGHNRTMDLPPASTAKTLTTLYALETLGGDFRFATRLVALGPVSGGVLRGDLALLGGGDPTLDSDGLADLAKALADAGIKRITGRFIVDPGPLPRLKHIDPGQPPQVAYDPGLGGLNLNFNRVFFRWQRVSGGYALRLEARGERESPLVEGMSISIVDREDPSYEYADDGGRVKWTVSQRALGRSGARWLPVRRPDIYAGEVFRTLAAARNVALPVPVIATAPAGGTLLARHDSKPLRDVLREMLKYSTNLTAELVGLTASFKRGGPVATLGESARRMTDWAKARFGITVRMVNHSGLSTTDRLSVTDLVTILHAGRSDDLRAILKPVYPRDARGMPEMRSPVKIRAKTGTLNFVSNLAGYVTTPDRQELIFAILAADVARSEAVPRADREFPAGVGYWTGRAHKLQQELILRWAAVYNAPLPAPVVTPPALTPAAVPKGGPRSGAGPARQG